MRCGDGCVIVANWYLSLGLSPNALGVLRPHGSYADADYVNHVRPDKVRGDSASTFYTCRAIIAAEESLSATFGLEWSRSNSHTIARGERRHA